MNSFFSRSTLRRKGTILVTVRSNSRQLGVNFLSRVADRGGCSSNRCLQKDVYSDWPNEKRHHLALETGKGWGGPSLHAQLSLGANCDPLRMISIRVPSPELTVRMFPFGAIAKPGAVETSP